MNIYFPFSPLPCRNPGNFLKAAGCWSGVNPGWRRWWLVVLLALTGLARGQDNQGVEGDFDWQQFGSTMDIYYYAGSGGNVQIPTAINGLPVTSIVNTNSPLISAFYNCPNPFQVVIPSTFTSLEAGTFENCSTLVGATLPEGMTNIGALAFSNSSLPAITLPASLVGIGQHAFDSCGSISDLVIPDNVTTIGDFAFNQDVSLLNLTLGAGVVTVGQHAFDSCWIYSLNLPSTLTSIGDGAFNGCRFGTVTIPAGVTNIGAAAFANCGGLTNVCFLGNAPAEGGGLFAGTAVSVIYYLAGTTGWGSQFDGIPTEPCAACGDDSGSLQVNITPDAVATNAAIGAFWELDYNGTWQTNAALLTGLAGGVHTVTFTNVPGWQTPPDQTITITNGLLTVIAGNYTPVSKSAVRVVIFPAGAATNGAQWQLDAGPWLSSGDLANDVVPGSHTVNFSSINGWFAPPSQTVSVTAGQTNLLNVTYQQAAWMQVVLHPDNAVVAGAAWAVDGGSWSASGTALALTNGTHIISFLPVAWWTTPANITVTLIAGETNRLDVPLSLGGGDSYSSTLATYDQQSLYDFTTLAGLPGSEGTADGPGTDATFNLPISVKLGAGNVLFVADFFNSTVRELTPVGTNWTVSTIAGQAGVTGHADGTNADALFDNPIGLAADTTGNVYVADFYAQAIRQLTPLGTNWVVGTIAGQPGVSGHADGTNTAATFSALADMAFSGGNLFVCDGNAIRELTPVGTNWAVTTIAGQVTVVGSADGTNVSALFNQPESVTPDNQGGLLVADYGNDTIRRLTPVGTNWVVTTVAGTAGTAGAADGLNNRATFANPFGVAVDGTGNIYVTDASNATVRKLVVQGTNYVETTIGGLARNTGSTDGLGGLARFNEPFGLAVDAPGNIYLADSSNNTIREGAVLPVPAITGITNGSGGVTVYCQAGAGRQYQVQFTTNLAAASWVNLGSPVTAVTNSLAIPDAGNTDASRFYRVLLVP